MYGIFHFDPLLALGTMPWAFKTMKFVYTGETALQLHCSAVAGSGILAVDCCSVAGWSSAESTGGALGTAVGTTDPALWSSSLVEYFGTVSVALAWQTVFPAVFLKN